MGWGQDFVCELARKKNHALIPAGASAPSLHEGFISVFVFLKPTGLQAYGSARRRGGAGFGGGGMCNKS